MKVFQYGGSFNDHDQPAYTGEHEVRCARKGCENRVTRDGSYSFVISFATRGADGRLESFTCPDQGEIRVGNYHAQHFCCSPECAAACAHACIDEHLVTQHQDHVAQLAAYDEAERQERAAFEEYKRMRAAQETARQQGMPEPLTAGGVIASPSIAIIGDDGPEIFTPAPLDPPPAPPSEEAVPIPPATEEAEAVPVPSATEPAIAVPASEPPAQESAPEEHTTEEQHDVSE